VWKLNVSLGRCRVKPLVETSNYWLKLHIKPLFSYGRHDLTRVIVLWDGQSIKCSVPGIERLIYYRGQRLLTKVSPVAFMYDARLGRKRSLRIFNSGYTWNFNFTPWLIVICDTSHVRNLRIRWRWFVIFTPRPIYTLRKSPRCPLGWRLDGLQPECCGEKRTLCPLR